MVLPSHDTRPREERDYKEIYPDLDENAQLAVFTVHENTDKQAQNHQVRKNSISHNTTSSISHNGIKKPPRKLKNQEMQHLSRLPRLVAEYGFRLRPHKSKLPSTYFREHSQHKPARQVMYDMDEQDKEFLEWWNSHRDHHVAVSPEVFEIVMSVLEEQWHNLANEMARVNSGQNTNEKLLTLEENFDRYGSDDGIGAASISEQRCAVCNDLECEQTNAIVFCDGCNIAVHQECYGIAFIPEGQWFCRRCMLSRGRNVDCTFCPSHTGAFKQLDNGLWSHVVCALWINEVYFANPIYLEPIEGIDSIPKNRWKLMCYICKQKKGACIQCTNRNCFQAYHVTCAKRAGLYMEMEKGMQGALQLKATLKLYCDRHGPVSWTRENVLHGITKTRMFYRDSRLLSQQNDKLVLERRQQNRINSFKWQTENNTPIAPQKFIDILFNCLLHLKVETTAGEFQPKSSSSLLRGLGNKQQISKIEIYDDLREASAELCRYWCLKRELKDGAPLVRASSTSPVVFLYDANSEMGVSSDLALKQLEEKILFGNTLIMDLQKVIDMAKITRGRQLIALKVSNLEINMADTVYFPWKLVAHRIFDHILKKIDTNNLLINETPKNGVLSFTEIRQKIDCYQYQNLEVLNEDITRLFLHIIEEHKSTSALGKCANRALNYWRSNGEVEMSLTAAGATGNIPFVQTSGFKFELKTYDPLHVLADENLSEVEEASITVNDPIWRRFITDDNHG